jgi:hypothetical protein
MTSMRHSSRPCSILVAVGLASCAIDDRGIDDLGTLDDGKGDTVLPRTVDVELEPNESRRFRIKAPAFVANLTQTGNVDAELTAKHFDIELASDVSRAPRLDASADGTVRNWTLTVFNRGSATLEATLVVDAPRARTELGIVSDIDKTVAPPAVNGELPPPYPGVASLYRTLELRAGGVAGDLRYVTARTPEGVIEIPAWMAMHDVPAGTIDTGISGVPFIAQKEKVADITRIFEARPDQRFVLFGDTSHRDPEAYREIVAKFPGRVLAVFIHKVNVTVNPARVDGMHLIHNYAEAAAALFGHELLTEDEARAVIEDARTGGLAITDTEIEDLIAAAR